MRVRFIWADAVVLTVLGPDASAATSSTITRRPPHRRRAAR